MWKSRKHELAGVTRWTLDGYMEEILWTLKVNFQQILSQMKFLKETSSGHPAQLSPIEVDSETALIWRQVCSRLER